MAIGLLRGPEGADGDDTDYRDLVRRWREAFIARFGNSQCRPIYDAMQAPGGPGTCTGVAGAAAALLTELIEAERSSRE